jgi:glycosyltransferase involved in cell wall biosynthesis
MRILYSVQRYGLDIVGGSESACRQFAEHLVQRGHDVSVITSCARSYVDWQNVYPEGDEVINGVVVHRLPVSDIRRAEHFGPLDRLMHEGPHPVPMAAQLRWAKAMGPHLVDQRRWLLEHAHEFDVAIFMTYLYATTTLGLPVLAGVVPTILQPTAHDEPPFRVGLMDSLFRLPDAMLFFTPEEREVVANRFGIDPMGNVVGIGIDLHEKGDVAAFRSAYGIGDSPYLLYAGRLDPMKGALELADFFRAYKERNGGDLKLVFAGEEVVPLPPHPDMCFTGFLSEDMKQGALAGALALVQSSYFESFSIVLCESWVQHRPALVQGASPVLAGQARRSGGAIPYRGFAEFEAAVELLRNTPELADRMGDNGRRYVDEHYRWDRVLERVEATAELAIERFAARPR